MYSNGHDTPREDNEMGNKKPLLTASDQIGHCRIVLEDFLFGSWSHKRRHYFVSYFALPFFTGQFRQDSERISKKDFSLEHAPSYVRKVQDLYYREHQMAHPMDERIGDFYYKKDKGTVVNCKVYFRHWHGRKCSMGWVLGTQFLNGSPERIRRALLGFSKRLELVLSQTGSGLLLTI